MASMSKHLFSFWLSSNTCFLYDLYHTFTLYSRVYNFTRDGHCQWTCQHVTDWLGSIRDLSQKGQLGNNLASTSSSFPLKNHFRLASNIFPCFSPHLQNADKLYKGHLSEFTPLASLHALSKPGNQRRGSAHQRSAANSHRSQGIQKKTMFTRWQGTPDYCTFSPLLRFADGSQCSKQGYPNNGAGSETSVWVLFSLVFPSCSVRHRGKHCCITNLAKTCLCYWDGDLRNPFCKGLHLKWPSLRFPCDFWHDTLWKVLERTAAASHRGLSGWMLPQTRAALLRSAHANIWQLK